MPYIQEANKICRFGEKVFNVAECIPVVGALTSIGRIQGSYLQEIIAICTIAAGSFTLMAALVSKNNEQKKSSRKLVVFGAEQLLHGALNTLHGWGALLLCCTGIGNVFLAIPHLINKDKFGPYVKYGVLTDPK